MNRWMTTVVVCGLLAFASTTHAGYRGPFEGRVVDAETRQPIQGAVVFMEWTWVKIGMKMDTLFDTDEVLTDERGYFQINKKWSWNPWLNYRVGATAMIYKAGYGAGVNLGTPWLRQRAASQKARSSEERKQLGPTFYFDIEFDDDGLPVFLLQKLTTEKERRVNLHDFPVSVPEDRMKLLRLEVARERKALGLN